jgi:hypothetical protein
MEQLTTDQPITHRNYGAPWEIPDPLLILKCWFCNTLFFKRIIDAPNHKFFS